MSRELYYEELVDKLSLIDRKKNLLEYPYKGSFPNTLKNVGDGSILTAGMKSSTSQLLLSDFSLPKGKYKASIVVTDIVDNNVDHNFTLAVEGADVTTDGQFELEEETAVTVYLNIPESFSADIVIKPQIEAGSEQTDWVPYMDKIGNYVDERFNGTNAKIRILAERIQQLEELLSGGVVLLAKEDKE